MSGLGFYPTQNATAPAKHISVSELMALASNPKIVEGGKHPAQANKAERNALKAQAALITPFGGSGKTKNAAENAAFYLVAIDHDHDNKTADQIRAIYDGLGVMWFAFTTASHTEDGNRWKVIVELANPVSAKEHAKLSQGLAHYLGADPAQARQQQGFYEPVKLSKDAPYCMINNSFLACACPRDLKSSFMVAVEAGWGALNNPEYTPAQVNSAPVKVRNLPTYTSGIIEKVNECFSNNIGQLLTDRGYKKVGGGFLSPWSESGAAGVRVFNDCTPEAKAYSHHSENDPLSNLNHDGHALDFAGALCALDFANDYTAMVKHYAPQVDPHGQKQRQREHAQKVAITSPANLFSDDQPYNLFGTFALPALPMDLIPSAIADYSADQGQLIGADPATMVIFCLGVAGACIDDRLKIQVKRYDHTWTESARLWCGVIGDPSVKKSPLLGKALAPAFAIDKEWRAETTKAMTEWRKQCDNTPKGEDEPPMPVGKRLLINDATVEKIGDILSKCEPRGMLSFQDELNGWLASMDAYKGGAGGKDKGSWLEAFNGGAKFFDRISRGELYVENWSVSVLGGIQPSVIQAYAQTTNHDGMLQRFILLYAQQPKELGQDRPPHPFAEMNYRELIKYLAMLKTDGRSVKLSEQAHEHREALERKVHAVVCNHPNLHLTAALGKWSGLYARLLLIWHCCDAHSKQQHPLSDVVTGETAEKVASFMWHILLPHLLKFYGAIDPLEDSSQDLARLILAKGWERFTVKRDFNQQWRASRNMKPWEIEQVLERLEGFNWIAPDSQAPINTNGTPTAYLVNPEVHTLHAEQAEAEKARRQEVAAALAELSTSKASVM